jgi:hypothetical protein
MGSRRDLQRLNHWMGNTRIMARVLRSLNKPPEPMDLVDLGAGDGNFVLQLARRLGPGWRGSLATLIDREHLLTQRTKHALEELGWQVVVARRDVLDWCRNPADKKLNRFVVTNLFLHHFALSQLTEILQEIARRSLAFIAIEPRRSRVSLTFSKLVGLIGCNDVTRHDAPASVRAGFRGRELSAIWPQDGPWKRREHAAGLFSHLFVAQRGQFQMK